MIAEKCKEKGIEAVVFDRGGFKYHGRIVVRAAARLLATSSAVLVVSRADMRASSLAQALADAAREAGLVF